MKPGRYWWIVLSLFFASAGGSLLIDAVRHPGPYADESVLLGGTLAGLGLASLLFAFKQRAQIRALAEHMGRHARRSRR
jgi:hypothetical protein